MTHHPPSAHQASTIPLPRPRGAPTLVSGIVKVSRHGSDIPESQSAPLVALVDGYVRRRKLQEKFLSKAGFRPHPLTNASDLLALLLVAPPDIVMIDTGVADIDPVELCRSLRKRRFFGPIVALASQADACLEIALLKAGANDFLLHTSPEAILEARLSAHLNAVRGYVRSIPNALLDGRELETIRQCLTEREYPLVRLLNDRTPHAATHAELYATGALKQPTVGALIKHMSRIRKKLAPFDLDVKSTPGAYRMSRRSSRCAT